MKKLRTLSVYLWAFCLTSSLLFGCKKEEEETKYMSGSLSFDLPSYIFPNDTLLLTAKGITAPKGDTVMYTFHGESFSPDSVVAKSCTMISPSECGSYFIVLKATADDALNISGQSTTRYTKVIPRVFRVMVKGLSIPNDSLIDPRDGTQYYYKRYGNLDWLVQNVHWMGAGKTYNDVVALGSMMGCLYTWNQALTGEDVPSTIPSPASGLAGGPQGVCPPGWHIPTPEDWEDLAMAISNQNNPFLGHWEGLAGSLCVDATVNDTKLWKYHPYNDKSNTSGWNGLPSGYGLTDGSSFLGIGQTAFWWSAGADGDQGYYRYVHYAVGQCSYAKADKASVYASVRCVRMAQQIEE